MEIASESFETFPNSSYHPDHFTPFTPTERIEDISLTCLHRSFLAYLISLKQFARAIDFCEKNESDPIISLHLAEAHLCLYFDDVSERSLNTASRILQELLDFLIMIEGAISASSSCNLSDCHQVKKRKLNENPISYSFHFKTQQLLKQPDTLFLADRLEFARFKVFNSSIYYLIPNY